MAVLNLNITMTVPDAKQSQYIDAFCFAEGYTGKDPAGTAETKTAFIKRHTAEWIKARVADGWTTQQQVAAGNTARADATADVVMT
jgi:hypothetical protein